MQAMIADSMIVPECAYRPGSFTGLMTLYESNYIKFSQLIVNFGSFPDSHDSIAVSSTEQDCDLHLAVERKQPYTTMLKLTYMFAREGSDSCGAVAVPDPDLWVYVYHDARLVEARKHREQPIPVVDCTRRRIHSMELSWRWRNNMLLNKWLDYLLLKGHRFPTQSG